MRYLLVITVFSLLSATLQADQKSAKSNLFKCVDDGSLTIDQSCVSSSVATDFAIHTEHSFAEIGADLGENELATMRFYPEKMLIEVVAHRQQPLTASSRVF